LRDAVANKTYGGADGRGDAWLRVGGLKGFVDGSLGSHTAAFHEPFTDAPKDRGLPGQYRRRSVSLDVRRRQNRPAQPDGFLSSSVRRVTAPEQKILVDAALRAYTSSAAYASIEQARPRRGSSGR